MRRTLRAKVASAAALTGAAGLVLLTAGPAWAQGSGSGSGTGSSSDSSSSSPTSDLGGYDLSSSAAGISVDYEQPNFPVPATPTLEFDLGYTTASYDSGPVGTANAAMLWPGPVVAGGGSELPLLVDPYLEEYAGPLASTIEPYVPTGLTYPVQAPSAYPGGPTSATNNDGPLAMSSSATDTASTASSSMVLVGGSNSSLPAGMLTVQAVGSTSEDTIDSLGNAVSEATSTVHDVDIADGLIDIASVTSTASSSSDGNTATLSGSSTATGVTIAGEPVSVSSSGISVLGNNENLLGSLVPTVNQILSTAGITMTLTSPTNTVSGASGQSLLQGLAVTINLSTFDADFSKLLSELPASLTGELSQLPVPTPYKQVITLDLGWAQVNANASPALTVSLGSTPSGTTSPLGAASALGPTGTTGLSTGGTPGTPGTGPTSGTPSSSPTPGAAIPSAAPALFKGIGTGLIILGLVLAAILVALMLGVDRAVGRVASAVPCVGENTGDLG